MVHFSQLRKELFLHESELNEGIGEMTKKLGSIASAALLVELRDKKVTVQYLSSHQAGFQKFAVNDPAESSFGGTRR